MENPAMVSYSLKEKYLQIEPEGRIRRYQYFVRMLVPGILFFLGVIFAVPLLIGVLLPVFGIAGFAVMLYAGIVGALVTQILYVILFYKIAITLITKRCHDFGSDGKIATTIYKVQIGITIINIIFAIFTLSSITVPGSSVLGNITQIIAIVNLIMGIFLLFRPGNKGDNQYGKDPVNTKVEFLG